MPKKMIRHAFFLSIAATLDPCGASAVPAQHAVSLTSTLDGVRAARLDRLPVVPKEAGSDRACVDHLTHAPHTPAGQAAVARGWKVLDEQAIGGMEAVVIAGGIAAGTSAVCLVQHGNIAIFARAKLIGVIYPRGDAGTSAVTMRRLGRNRLRLVGVVGPYADLTLANGVVSVGAPSASEPVCGGKARVPAIFSSPIANARQVLIAQGWRPVAHARPTDDLSSRTVDYWRKGWKEVSGCSGTGLGYCGFDYTQRSIGLSVTTTDDPPQVADYTVDCGRGKSPG